MSWDGSVVIWPRRILFAGQAEQSISHSSHTLMVCVAYGGSFSISAGPKGSKPQSYSAALIAPETKHSMDGSRAGFMMLLHLLPETEEAMELRRRYLTRTRVYRIPVATAEKLSSFVMRIQNLWPLDCKDAKKFRDLVVGELIALPPKRRGRLDWEVSFHIKRVIKDLYSGMEELRRGRNPGKEWFTSASVVKRLGLDRISWDGKDLEREFKKNTGASYDDYVKLLRYRATLAKFADDEADLRARNKRKGGGSVSDADRENARRITLTKAAELLDWGGLYNLDRASTDIIGISPNSLKIRSVFNACEEGEKPQGAARKQGTRPAN